MALSGSFSAGIRSNKYKLRVDWSATQSVTDNTSVVTCTMYLVQASGFDLYISGRSNTTTINGESKTWSSPAISGAAGKTTKLGSVKSSAINHNADGTKSITIKAVFNVRATISGTYYETITATETVTLDTIPRATTPTLSASSVYMGSSVTITMPRASSNFTHDLAYSFEGASYVGIATGQGTSYSWSVPASLANLIPKATSGVVTVRCITKNGSTVIGTKYVSLTAKVIYAQVEPTILTYSVRAKNTGPFAGATAFIKGASQAVITVNAAGLYNSTITAYHVEVDGKVYNSNSFTSDVLTGGGDVTIKVKDSRGYWSNAVTQSISFLSYEKPKITNFRVYRVNQYTGAEDPEGTSLAIDYSYSATSVLHADSGKELNYVTIKHEYKLPSDANWCSLQSWGVGEAPLSDLMFVIYPNYPAERQYDVRVTVTDAIGNFATYTGLLTTADVILDINADGTAIGFGKVSEQSGVDEFGRPVEFQNSVYGTVMGIGKLPQLPAPSNFDNYTEVGCWAVYSNLDAQRNVNMPVQVAGRLEVSAATGEGVRATEWSYLRQRFIPYRTEYPTYERDVSRDTSNTWTFGEWIPTTLRGRKVLYSGSWYMNGDQSITLSEPVSAQNNGIVLVFSRFNTDTLVADNGNFNSFFVHKELVRLQSGNGHCFSMNAVNYSYICSKYLYISDITITGNDLNGTNGTSPKGITYNNTAYVLRYVIGV